ncbi:hypothetical protein SY88_20470 [Clostridiales bacterium PH28_bin88]|nr:hypothetical protein SY88_20470 [Clostridiales bacterium PH28_bin88]
MVQDVMTVFSRMDISINSMEVSIGTIYVKFLATNKGKLITIRDLLLAVPDVIDVLDTGLMPYEEREQQLKAILQSVNEGIVAVDTKGAIMHVNEVIENMIFEKGLGQNIYKFVDRDSPIWECLQSGKPYENKEVMFKTKRGPVHCITSGRPIRNEVGEVTGIVATLKAMNEVRKLVSTISKANTGCFNEIHRISSAMENVVQMARTVAASNATIMIRGESGTGKELFARAIHEASPRSDKPFIPVNCAALPETLIESELFGYEEGAFSGARKGGAIGLFEAAHGGTLFLDEIGEIPPNLQGKLLRVVQEGMVRRIGGQKQIPVDVRIIAATNCDLDQMVKTGAFRQDLYYRLNVIPLFIPPLRERREDIAVLVDHFLQKFSDQQGRKITISTDAKIKLVSYDWPGNVRELQNVIQRAINLSLDDQITSSGLLFDHVVPAFSPRPSQKGELKGVLEDAEKVLLERTLSSERSARAAARVLGLSHTAVLKKIHKHNLGHLLRNGIVKTSGPRKIL